jgi:hypothetical protein
MPEMLPITWAKQKAAFTTDPEFLPIHFIAS